MRKVAFIVSAALILAGQTAIAAPIPSAAVTSVSSGDSFVVKTAYHSHKNMKKVHKAQRHGARK